MCQFGDTLSIGWLMQLSHARQGVPAIFAYGIPLPRRRADEPKRSEI